MMPVMLLLYPIPLLPFPILFHLDPKVAFDTRRAAIWTLFSSKPACVWREPLESTLTFDVALFYLGCKSDVSHLSDHNFALFGSSLLYPIRISTVVNFFASQK